MNAQFSVSSTNETCHNSGNGTISVHNTSGTAYSLSLSSGNSNSQYTVYTTDTTITGLQADNFNLRIDAILIASNNVMNDSLIATANSSATNTTIDSSASAPQTNSATFLDTNITITTPDAVIADFNPSTTVADGSAPVFFSNASSGADSYTWNFGDGNTASSLDASHSFNAVGNYTVTLTATNTNGCTSSHTDVVSVTPPSAPSNYFMSRENLAGDGPGMARMSHTNFNTSATPGSILINNTGDVDGDYSVTVMNMNGQIFATQQTNNSNITLSVDGGQIYLVYITSPDGTTTSEKIYVSK
jgi:PKD repeat protein